MHMLTKFFTAASRFFRPAAKTEAVDRTAPTDTMNWLSPPSGGARTWEEALAPSDAADVNDAPNPTVR